MKKRLICAAIIVFSCLTSSTAMAVSFGLITIRCPVTSGNIINQLRNFAGNFIAGNGFETEDANPQTFLIAFKSQGALPRAIPSNLSSYFSINAVYNNADGANPLVTCVYASSNGSLPQFSVSYAGNTPGADVLSSTANSITLSVPIGIRM